MKEKEIARERECDTDYAIPMTLPPDPTRSAAPSCRYWCAAGFRACCDSGRDGSCQHGIFRLPHAPLPGPSLGNPKLNEWAALLQQSLSLRKNVEAASSRCSDQQLSIVR